MLPSDFTSLHALAICLLFGFWFAYTQILKLFARGSLNTQLEVVRNHWLTAASMRDAKPFDAVLLGHITNSIAFFGSATMIVLAGIITAFANVKTIHGTISEIHFIGQTSLELFAVQVGLLTIVLAISFFSFTYALRKLIYVIALVGALPDASQTRDPHETMIKGAATVLSEAIKTFNFGIRGYYYFVAALCLFISPYACLAMTTIMTGALFYRQLATPTARAIRDYVEAAKSIER